MKKLTTLYACAILAFLSCSDSDDPMPPFSGVEKVRGLYLFSKEEHLAYTSVGGDTQFAYSNKYLVKRTGGCTWLPTEEMEVCTDKIYDTLIYNQTRTLRIYAWENIDGWSLFPFEREITLRNGLIERKITALSTIYGLDADTIYYFYNSQKQLQKTEQWIGNKIVTRDYFFDDRGNLERISGTKKWRANNTVIDTTEETFGGYDDKPNPLKGLYFWPDIFYRALSNNNFTTYTFKSKSIDEHKSWDLVYDEAGEVDFSK